jgi:hypothetical protein
MGSKILFKLVFINIVTTTAVQQQYSKRLGSLLAVTIVDENKLEKYFAAHIVPGPEQC